MAKSQYDKICERLKKLEEKTEGMQIEILQRMTAVETMISNLSKNSNGRRSKENKPLLIAVATIVLSQILMNVLPELLAFFGEAAIN